jgi:hypothetical protein
MEDLVKPLDSVHILHLSGFNCGYVNVLLQIISRGAIHVYPLRGLFQ